MEHQLWKAIVACLGRLDKSRAKRNACFTDGRIVQVHFWAVLHDRPISWAVQKANWPIHLRKLALPSSTAMSRRLRSPGVRKLLAEFEAHVLRPAQSDSLVWYIDGKPLVISSVSKDRQAGYGRAAGGKAKGYKLHAVIGVDNTLAAWRLAPMNVDEREMASRMLPQAKVQGYLVSDANYDSNHLHALCEQHGNLQMVTPRRYGPDRGHGHRRQRAGRLRSKEILENPRPWFGQSLREQRADIERYFGNLTNWGGSLTHLPPWARTYRRVHRWVQAKLILLHLRRQLLTTTYVA